ncbi:MAG: 16S rRNA (uracil(1498)-N(3))-methyltransferase [Betaproteobacteria bacterium]|nr:16S rRNA (uracil(1498)-N(3))-methyltransferase [Betaproteobacteria bacterium]
MSAPRFHCAELPRPSRSGQAFTLPAAVASHAVRVLRLRVGDVLVLFDGEGGEVPATLADVARECATVTLGEYSQVDRESPLDLWLVQALAVGDKMDWIVQKAVELGATGIVPWQADRSVLKLDAARADKRRAHWEAVAISACEQCGRNRIPFVDAPLSLTAALARSASRRVVAMMPGVAGPSAFRAEPMALVVGPEGGFSDAEAKLLRATNVATLTLGPRILRTETAGLAALAALNARFGDFGLTAG